MNFLAKAAQVVLKLIGVATGILPIIKPVVSNPETQKVLAATQDDLTKIQSAVISVEQVAASVGKAGTNIPDSQRIAAAVPFVAQVIQQSELLANKKVHDEKLFEDATTRLTQAMSDILKSFGD